MRQVEKLLMNNPLRTWIQRRMEAPRVFRGVDLPAGCACLEIGCGRGVGGLLIAGRFDAARVTCVDIDPAMIGRARRYISRPPGWARGVRTGAIELIEGDAASLHLPDATFDAVFQFGLLHHIEQWRRVIEEVARVLRGGGVFSFEEVLGGQWGLGVSRYFRHSPISARELEQALQAARLEVQDFRVPMGMWCFCRAVKPAG